MSSPVWKLCPRLANMRPSRKVIAALRRLNSFSNTIWQAWYNRSYIRGSVHRNSRLKKSSKMQQYADIYLLLNYCTCFGRPSRPSSGVHKSVVAASGTDHTIWGACYLKRDQIRICTRGCNYTFMYSWWWARWTPETCAVHVHLVGFLHPVML